MCGPTGTILDLRAENWSGPGLGPFWSKDGAQKMFCARMISLGKITGVPLRVMDCMMPGKLLGRFFPPNPLDQQKTRQTKQKK